MLLSFYLSFSVLGYHFAFSHLGLLVLTVSQTFFKTLIVLRSTGQVFCRTSIKWNLPVFPMLKPTYFKKITEVKMLLVVSRVHTVNLAKVVFVHFLNIKLLFSSLSSEVTMCSPYKKEWGITVPLLRAEYLHKFRIFVFGRFVSYPYLIISIWTVFYILSYQYFFRFSNCSSFGYCDLSFGSCVSLSYHCHGRFVLFWGGGIFKFFCNLALRDVPISHISKNPWSFFIREWC